VVIDRSDADPAWHTADQFSNGIPVDFGVSTWLAASFGPEKPVISRLRALAYEIAVIRTRIADELCRASIARLRAMEQAKTAPSDEDFETIGPKTIGFALGRDCAMAGA
jgi:hypothetical protein